MLGVCDNKTAVGEAMCGDCLRANTARPLCLSFWVSLSFPPVAFVFLFFFFFGRQDRGDRREGKVLWRSECRAGKEGKK